MSAPPSTRRRTLLAGGMALLLAARAGASPAAEPPRPELALVDHHGRPRRLADWRGKVIVLSFGYTQCPDVCPTTLAVLAEAMRLLGTDAPHVQVLFATVDPARDTQAVLGRYVPAFDPSFVGLRGSKAATASAAEAFGVEYEVRPGRTPQSYTVDHTAASFLLDREGRLRTVVAYGQGPKVFARDIASLLAGPAGGPR